MFVACAFASIYNATINQDSIFCIPTKPFLCIILTLLICWAFLCVAVFCLNATRTDLWRVRVLLSRAQPFGPSLSENTTIGYKTWACRSTPVKNQLHHVWLFSVYFETVDCSRENLNWWDFDWDFSHIESVRGGGETCGIGDQDSYVPILKGLSLSISKTLFPKEKIQFVIEAGL